MTSSTQETTYLAAPWTAQHYGLQSFDVVDDECTKSIYTLCSQQSSTNLTGSDLPGAGRTLGQLYSRWGRALEVSIGRIAHRSGFGPDAVASRIERVTFIGRWTNNGKPKEDGNARKGAVEWSAADGNDAKLRADCQKLVSYCTADVRQTREQALLHIIRLITSQPRFRPFFNTPSNLITLRCAATQLTSISSCGSSRHDDELKNQLETVFLAKEALLSIEDNALNAVVDDISQLPVVRHNRSEAVTFQCTATVTKLLELCWNPRYSFVAKRHLFSASNYLPWVSICQISPALTAFLERSIKQIIDSQLTSFSSSPNGNDPRADLDSTERLTEVILLPRCRAMHSLDAGLKLRWRTDVHSQYCRCTKNATVNDQMRSILSLLQNPIARKVFPRAAAIAQDVWHSEGDG